MCNLYWLTDAQMVRLQPFFPKSHGVPRVLSGIIFINRNGLRWPDAPKEYGPAKTLYNRWKRWGDMGVFARMMEGLASEAAVPKTAIIDASYLKAHRTASSLGVKKGAWLPDWQNQRWHDYQIAYRHCRKRPTDPLLYNDDWFRDALKNKGITPCLPGRRSRAKPVKHDKRRYKRCNWIEIMFGRLKDWRRVATRYDSRKPLP